MTNKVETSQIVWIYIRILDLHPNNPEAIVLSHLKQFNLIYLIPILQLILITSKSIMARLWETSWIKFFISEPIIETVVQISRKSLCGLSLRLITILECFIL